MKKVLLGGLVASTLSLNAFALDLEGWYLGAGLNRDAQFDSSLSIDFDEFDDITDSKSELDSADIGFNLFAGKEINKYLAFEGGLMVFGDSNFKTKNNVVEDDASVQNSETLAKTTAEAWSLYTVGIARAPVSEYFNVYAKAGPAYLNAKETTTLYNYVDDERETAGKITDEADGFALMYGAGVEFNYDQFGVRLDYTAFKPQSDVNDRMYIADLVSLNALYRF